MDTFRVQNMKILNPNCASEKVIIVLRFYEVENFLNNNLYILLLGCEMVSRSFAFGLVTKGLDDEKRK